MTTAQLTADLTDFHAQLREARELLEQVPEGLLGKFHDMLLKSVAVGSLEIGEPILCAAIPATHRVCVRLGGRFDEVVSAMRAKKFDVG